MTIAEQINAVIRRVASTGDRHAITVQQTYPTTVDDLWSACTEADRLARWFEPVEGDLQAGGRYRLTDSGTEGTIEFCDRPATLRITWEYGGDMTHVEVGFAAAAVGGSVLSITHLVPDNEQWTEYGPMAAGVGWDSSLLALAKLIAGDPGAAPEEMLRFSQSDEGGEYLAATAARWEQVWVDTGADRQLARDAAERAVAAYREM